MKVFDTMMMVMLCLSIKDNDKYEEIIKYSKFISFIF